MNNTQCILVLETNHTKNNKISAIETILFTPALKWVEIAIEKLGYSNYFFVGDSQELKEDYSLNSSKELAKMLEKTKTENFLVIGADAPLIDDDEVKGAFKYHEASDIEVTFFSTENQLATGAGWYSKATLLKLAHKFEDGFSLYDLYSHVTDEILNYNRYWVEPTSIMPANSSINRAQLSAQAREDVVKKHLYNDVDIPIIDGIMISPQVKIGSGTTILPGTILKGETIIGENCTIGPNSQLDNTIIEDGTNITAVFSEDSSVGKQTNIGPMSRLRPGTTIGDKVKIGNFVEVKNSSVGDKTAISHLTYVGDSEVGKECNIGCGVVTVNYDGKNKHKTTIGDNVFVGCNCNLVAPVTLGDGVYAAAGTTITEDVPKDALVIGRSRQEVKKDWAKGK